MDFGHKQALLYLYPIKLYSRLYSTVQYVINTFHIWWTEEWGILPQYGSPTVVPVQKITYTMKIVANECQYCINHYWYKTKEKGIIEKIKDSENMVMDDNWRNKHLCDTKFGNIVPDPCWRVIECSALHLVEVPLGIMFQEATVKMSPTFNLAQGYTSRFSTSFGNATAKSQIPFYSITYC